MSNKQLLECPVCNSQFEVEQSIAACSGCPLAKSCGKKKCPYCGEEFIPELYRSTGSDKDK